MVNHYNTIDNAYSGTVVVFVVVVARGYHPRAYASAITFAGGRHCTMLQQPTPPVPAASHRLGEQIFFLIARRQWEFEKSDAGRRKNRHGRPDEFALQSVCRHFYVSACVRQVTTFLLPMRRCAWRAYKTMWWRNFVFVLAQPSPWIFLAGRDVTIVTENRKV